MKRSSINQAIENARAYFESYRWALPPFAFFTPDEWRKAGPEYDAVRECMLGWDLTDFGSGDFEKVGLLLFTIRNGRLGSQVYDKPYAEKLMLVRKHQKTPFHFHWHKMEDIINRGGGVLKLRFFASDEQEQRVETPVVVLCDGRQITLAPEEELCLQPGESVTIPRRVYHEFWAEDADTIVGEVSQVNDDNADNRFYLPAGRFPAIEEDEPPRYLLCNEYPFADR